MCIACACVYIFIGVCNVQCISYVQMVMDTKTVLSLSRSLALSLSRSAQRGPMVSELGEGPKVLTWLLAKGDNRNANY